MKRLHKSIAGLASLVVLALAAGVVAQTRTDSRVAPVPIAPATRVPTDRQDIGLSFAPLVRATSSAVVNVYAARRAPDRSPFADDPMFRRFFGGSDRPRMESSLGSGVIVDPSGLVVTNNHVIDGADQIRVALADGREFDARRLSADARTDLAVLRIEGENAFPSVAIGDSDTAQIGDLVLAIGNPFGIGQTVTSGIVSALARTHVGVDDFGYFIQTDAAINPGNSGGALIDMSGELLGVNTAIFSRSGGSNGIGFAIPSNMVRAFVDAARDGRRFERPYVGAVFSAVGPDIAEAVGLPRPMGALVQAVSPDGPAAKAGLAPGEVVLAMNGFPIENPDSLGYRLATAGLEGFATLTVLKPSGEEDATLALAPAPETPERDEQVLRNATPLAGATVANLSPRLADELELPQSLRGVVVTEVARGSPAARFGLRPKDVVAAVNGDEPASSADLAERLTTLRGPWRIEVDRGGRRFVQVVR